MHRRLLAIVAVLSIGGCAHLEAIARDVVMPCIGEPTVEAFAACAAIPAGEYGLREAWIAAKRDPARVPDLAALVAEIKAAAE